MKQIWLVTKREFLVEVRKKSFIILTLAMPFLMVLFGVIIVFLNIANLETNHIAVIDESGLFEDSFKSNQHNQYSFHTTKEMNELKETKSLTGILFIPKTDSTFTTLENGIEFISNKNVGVSLLPNIEKKIEKKITEINLKRKGISPQDLEEAEAKVNITVTQESGEENSKNTNQMQENVKSVFSGILMYSTFMFIMIYSVRVMRSVIEEKNNRVVEIIISSIKPFNLMMGKILGSTLVAITQFVIWIALILTFLLISPILIDSFLSPAQQVGEIATTTSNDFSEIEQIIRAILEMNIPLIISVFFIYFFFGYLFYSSLFAAIGASVESDTETQQFMWIGISPLLLGLYGSISIFENPDGPVGYWFSMIPFTSPITMMARIGFSVPIGQLLLSIGLLIGSVFLMVWFAAKIYRVGILMYGKKPSIKEWLKWIKY